MLVMRDEVVTSRAEKRNCRLTFRGKEFVFVHGSDSYYIKNNYFEVLVRQCVLIFFFRI